MKKNTVVSRLEKMVEAIELMKWESGIEAFKFTRTLLIGCDKEITAFDLKMEIEDGLLILSDMQDELMHNELSGFVLDNIKEVNIKKSSFEIITPSMYLTIESLPDIHAPEETYEAALSN
jgi:hypothetical protein